MNKAFQNEEHELNVSLAEMLNARERRALWQKHLLSRSPGTLICLTFNIPGPVKILPGVAQAFQAACEAIANALAENDILIGSVDVFKEKTGYEAFYCVSGDPDKVKSILVFLEERDRVGRLYDIDVLRPDGSKVSREDLGLPGRTCLLCKQPAQICARSRKHSVDHLVTEITRILKENAQEHSS